MLSQNVHTVPSYCKHGVVRSLYQDSHCHLGKYVDPQLTIDDVYNENNTYNNSNKIMPQYKSHTRGDMTV